MATKKPKAEKAAAGKPAAESKMLIEIPEELTAEIRQAAELLGVRVGDVKQLVSDRAFKALEDLRGKVAELYVEELRAKLAKGGGSK